jgi:membrane-associated protein
MMLFIDTTNLIAWGGLFIIAFLIFAETGFLLGLAIPGGETLVFTAGLLVSTGTLQISLFALILVLVASAMLGDVSGYAIGKKFGKRLYNKEDTWWYRKKYFSIARNYLTKHSQFALIGGKFLPIIRPFSPVVAGMTPVPFTRFISLTSVAAILYVTSFVLAGYFLGKQFPIIKDYLGWILPLSIAVAITVMIVQAKKYKKDQENEQVLSP